MTELQTHCLSNEIQNSSYLDILVANFDLGI